MTSDAGALSDMFGGDDRRLLAAHIWRRVPDGFYLEPEWCSEQLLAVESSSAPFGTLAAAPGGFHRRHAALGIPTVADRYC